MAIPLSSIEAVLHTEDIEGLIGLGTPPDEYADEAAEISKALSSVPGDALTPEVIADIIATVWARYFHLSEGENAYRMPAFRRVALKIL